MGRRFWLKRPLQGLKLRVVMAGSSSSLGSASEECDISAIADAWDAAPGIRERLREGLTLFQEAGDKALDLKVAVRNGALLEPVLTRMRECNRKLPGIDAVRHEVTSLLKLNRREIERCEVESASWCIRKYVGLVKMKTRKVDPSTATSAVISSVFLSLSDFILPTTLIKTQHLYVLI